jgi:hypothetical protein
MTARNYLSNSATGRIQGPKSASARPGPCTRPRSADASPGGNTTRPESARRQGRSSSAARSPASGCAERWIRTLKEQCRWAELHDTTDELRKAVAGFVEDYNTSWLIQRHGYQTPKEAYQAAQAAAAA